MQAIIDLQASPEDQALQDEDEETKQNDLRGGSNTSKRFDI